MPEPKLTLAVEHYDRHLPLLDRSVTAEGIQLEVRHVTVESGRHERMLDGLEWDCAELSLSSYIMAITRGAPLTAIPVFPRRLFSQSQMYVNTAAGINGPQDLIGKRVGLRSFTSVNVRSASVTAARRPKTASQAGCTSSPRWRAASRFSATQRRVTRSSSPAIRPV